MARSTSPSVALTPDSVAGKAKRKRRKRTRAATVQRRIEARSRERQRAWADGGLADLTSELTRKLDLDFAEVRDQEAGNPGEPFAGRTTRAGRG